MALSLETFLKNIRQQLAEGDIELALDQLQNYLSAGAPDLRDEAVMLMGRYMRLRKEERKGIITREAFQVDVNRLSQNILSFLKEVARKVVPEALPIQSSKGSSHRLTIPEEVGFEKILGVNNLKQIAWIEEGIRVSKSVCRILTPNGLGSGFLIAPDLVMTNNHVLGSKDIAAKSIIEFDYQFNFTGHQLKTSRYQLDRERFHTNRELDYSIVGIITKATSPPLEHWGDLCLNPNADPFPGEHVIIIQHPNGGPKQIAMTANQVISKWEHRLHYTTDTMPGSSGSPVFNDLWQVIAIHHAGGELQINANKERRFINEGVLMSAIQPDAGIFWPK